MDLNGNGKPDFLDFYGVSQIHIDNSSSAASSGRVSTASSVIAAAEMNLPVPSMIWLDKLRSQAEDPNTFLVTLDAGIEYTFEISKNLTKFLGGTLPNIKIYDPANAVLSLDEAQEMTEVEITAYPKEHPSIFCYTIKPEVSGNYLVQIQNGEPISNTSHDFDNTDSVLFIYKERRNENGEPGYYTNFKFTDSEGTQTTALNISDIIELRKLFIEANLTYFDEIYVQNLPDDEYGMGNNSGSFTISDDYEEYDNFLELVQAKVGVVYSVDLDLLALLEQEYMSEADFKKLEAALIAIESLDITAPNYETGLKALLKDFEQDSQNYEAALDGVLVTKVIAPNINASNVNISAGADDMYTSIPSDINGIPYEDRYLIGRGIMAITMLDPPGGMEVGTIKDAYQQAFAAYDYDGDNTRTSKDASMHPRNTDTQPLTTDKYIKFISTASQAESLTKTNSEVSIATSALGISAGTGSTNNFKFGITSTTLVIHFEETEIGYRELTFDQTLNAWNKAGFFNIISSEIFYQTGPDFVKNFRNDFGDYYVAGYQYGACYDAYISITTKTSEQLEKITSKLSANLNLDSFNASFDLSRETQKTLSEAGTEISIRIITNGMGHEPQEIPMPQGVSSRDLKAVNHVFATISDFNGKLTNNSQRSQYAPIRVKMNRWKNNLIMGMLMKIKGDTDGRIPVTIGQKKKILALNSKLRSLRAYRNVVTDNPAINGTAAKEIEPRFSSLFGTITGVKEEFYTEKYQADFESVDREVDYLIPKFKAFADRYAFHTKLVLAQQAEKKLYNDLLDSANKFEEGSSEAYAVIKQMPFGKADVGGIIFVGEESIMRNAKIILLLLGGLLLLSGGCGGGGSNFSVYSPDSQEIDGEIAKFIHSVLDSSSDGSPSIFDYAPQFELSNNNVVPDPQDLHFVKYISSADLNYNDDFVKTIHLNQNSEYIIKYSHGGRNLNDTTLNLKISAPDNREIILDLTKKGVPGISPDIISEDEQPYYIPTDFETIPEENPCIILYGFQAPMTGDYEFAISELTFVSGDGLIKNTSLDMPFEFRIYASDEYHSSIDSIDEEIAFSPREILDIQRILWDYATEINDNGLPFFDFDFHEEEANISAANNNPPSELVQDITKKYQAAKERSTIEQSQQVIPPSVISNVPYESYYKEGAGFYAHSGLRGVTNVVDDKSFSRNAIENFTLPTPESGNAYSMNENFKVNIIATKEEHDRTMELNNTSNFALLRDALGDSQRKDYARLGSDHTKIISVRYEFAENAPRTPDPKNFKLYNVALEILKQGGRENFLKEFGDYFVEGYTWGLCYDAAIEIVITPGKSYYLPVVPYRARESSINDSFYIINDIEPIYGSSPLCDSAGRHIQELLTLVFNNAVSERDTGKSLPNKANINMILNILQNNYLKTTIRVSHSSKTGRLTDMSFSVADFVNDLENFIKSAKQTPRSQYAGLYVSLRRYREIEDAKPYIPEYLTVKKDHYNAIRRLTEKIFLTQCYYNALMSINEGHSLQVGKTAAKNTILQYQEDLQDMTRARLFKLTSMQEDMTRITIKNLLPAAMEKKLSEVVTMMNIYIYTGITKAERPEGSKYS